MLNSEHLDFNNNVLKMLKVSIIFAIGFGK